MHRFSIKAPQRPAHGAPGNYEASSALPGKIILPIVNSSNYRGKLIILDPSTRIHRKVNTRILGNFGGDKVVLFEYQHPLTCHNEEELENQLGILPPSLGERGRKSAWIKGGITDGNDTHDVGRRKETAPYLPSVPFCLPSAIARRTRSGVTGSSHTNAPVASATAFAIAAAVATTGVSPAPFAP